MLGAHNFLGDPYATVRNLVRLPPHRRKTFVYDTPAQTHFRQASCAEAAARGECNNYAQGFAIPIEPGEDIEDYERKLTASGYTFSRGDAPPHMADAYPAGTRWLVFPPEQRCLKSFKAPHRIPLDHDPILSIRGGDFRHFTGDNTHLTRMDDWVDALRTTTDKLHDEIEKG